MNLKIKATNIFLLFWVIFLSSLFLLFSLRAIFYPYPLNYSEGHIIALSKELKNSGSYFGSIDRYPFLHGTYPPIFPYLLTFFLNFSSSIFIPGRIISFFSTIFIVIYLFKIFFLESKNKYFSIFFSITFLLPLFVLQWSSLTRVDMLGLAFNTIGLYIYLKYRKRESSLRFFSIPFLVLSFYTKQIIIAAPLAIISYNMIRRKKESFKFIVFFVLPIIIIFIFLNLVSKNQFYLHLFKYNYIVPISFKAVLVAYQNFFQIIPVLLIFFLYNLFISKKYNLISFYCIINFCLLFIKGKIGADINYFIEPFISFLLLGGLIFIDLYKTAKKKMKYFLLSVFALQIFLLAPYNVIQELLSNPLVPEGDEQRMNINFYVKKYGSRTLSEDLGYLVSNNLPVFYEPFQFVMLSERGLWKEDIIINDCNNKRFTLIVAGRRILRLRGMQECLAENYDLVDSIEKAEGLTDYDIYLPKN